MPTSITGIIGIEWEPQLHLVRFEGHAVFVRPTSKDFIHTSHVPSPRMIKLLIPTDIVPDRSAHGSMYLDSNGNLEVRSNPVTIEGLADEIRRCYEILQWVIKRIAEAVGPTYVLLPKTALTGDDSGPNKHINLSADIRSNPYRSKVQLKRAWGGGRRLHLTAPYNFRDYTGLMEVYRNAYAEAWSELMEKFPRIGKKATLQATTLSEEMDLNKLLSRIAAYAAADYIERWADEHPMTKPLVLGYSMTGEEFVSVRHLF